MENKITFKNLIIVLWITTLILIFSLYRFEYFPYASNDRFVIKVNRITGEVEFIQGKFYTD